MTTPSSFKTAEGAAEYLAAYNRTLALWPVPHEAIDVPTRFGTTHVNMAGSVDAPALILLHGFAVSSTEWYANVAPLSQHFRVYALDAVNQMGLSVVTRPLKTRQESADWLTDVMDGLNIERAVVVGHSYGGWLTLNLALLAPQRVERMILLSPASSFASLRWQFALQFLGTFLMPSRKAMYRFMQQTTTMRLVDGQAEVEQLILGIKHLKPTQFGAPIIAVFKDEELKQINIPTLLLVGEQDTSCKPVKVLERARRVMPLIEADLIVGGGHLFPVDQAETTNARMLKFLNQGEQ
jgi:pimeloyl-ACP methyl ester carboxylesterase